MPIIHASALVDTGAELAEGVTIGPYAVIGSQVKIGAHTQVGPHCVITGDTTIGQHNHFFPFSSIGEAPQDKKYAGEATRLVIGNRNTVREYCTLNTGTVQDKGVTTVGDDNWIMAYVHIAHDCSVGNHTTIANCTQLGGHVEIGDWVVLGGFTGIHQFCRVGAHAMCAVGTKLVQDVPPYVMAEGSPAAPRGLNTEGMKRRGFSADDIKLIKRAYKILYRDGLLLEQAKQELQNLLDQSGLQALKNFLTFIQMPGRGLIR
jgi:UDP-N-acetylglucosamine acyltransferase